MHSSVNISRLMIFLKQLLYGLNSSFVSRPRRPIVMEYRKYLCADENGILDKNGLKRQRGWREKIRGKYNYCGRKGNGLKRKGKEKTG